MFLPRHKFIHILVFIDRNLWIFLALLVPRFLYAELTGFLSLIILFSCCLCMLQPAMAVQHYHPLCVPPAHPSFQEGSPVEAFSKHQSFQRESSADQPLERGNEVTPSQTKQLCSPGLASNARTQRSATGSCYTGSVNAQHIGLSGFGLERPEKQIRIELERLYNVLQRSDKYQKYREKQPILTAAEVLARDAADRKERERWEAENVPQNQKDTTVWPDFLEFAFWKGMVPNPILCPCNPLVFLTPCSPEYQYLDRISDA